MLIRTLGTILLGLGFVALASATLMQDPTAMDANIGAGILTVVGIPVGTFGLALTLTHAIAETWRRRRGSRASRS